MLLVGTVLVSLALGRYPIGPADALELLASRVAPGFGDFSAQQETLFFNVRLPRILLVILVGASLSAAGAAFQGIFQNPLVSPDFLGASQGAAFGACWAILAGGTSLAISGSAFAVSLAAVGIVLLVSSRARGNRILVTVLAGIMVKSLFEAGVSYTKLVADPVQPAASHHVLAARLVQRRQGGRPRAGGRPHRDRPCRPHGHALAPQRPHDVDDEALSMGVNAPRVRAVAVLFSALVTAASVAVSGLIGWVGLVVPHLARGLVGSDYRHLLPASMLAGATFLLVVDDIARLALTAEIPIGILTSVVGAPFFLWLIVKRGRG